MASATTSRTGAEALGSDAVRLGAFRDATSKMQALSGTDNRSSVYWAGIHGFPQWQCWHHSKVGMGQQLSYDLFLPWHRAYLLHVEHALRDQNDAAAIPWWDWTSPDSHRNGVPKAYSEGNVSGSANPLFSGPVPSIQGDPARWTARYPGNPAELPSTADVEGILILDSFTDFQAQLQQFHDDVHGWTGGSNPSDPSDGGDMGNVGVAAFDPIFWAHHCMIDRIWYLWQLRHGVSNIPPKYLTMPLAPFAMTVENVLDINKLGYEYALASIAAS